MRIAIILISILIAQTSASQDISGFWEGTTNNQTSYIRLVIIKCGDKYVGYTFDYGYGSFCQANFVGNFNIKRRKLTGEGNEMIQGSPSHTLCNYELYFRNRKGKSTLSGEFWSKNTSTAQVFKTRMELKKIDTLIDTTEYMRKSLIILNSSVFNWKLNDHSYNDPVPNSLTGKMTLCQTRFYS